MHEQIIICCQTQLDNIAHEETIIILYPVIRTSLGGLSANEKEVQFALNDNDIKWQDNMLHSLRKAADISWHNHWFPCEIMLRNMN